nr:hypothetical protein [Oscillochloris trichoides]
MPTHPSDDQPPMVDAQISIVSAKKSWDAPHGFDKLSFGKLSHRQRASGAVAELVEAPRCHLCAILRYYQ